MRGCNHGSPDRSLDPTPCLDVSLLQHSAYSGPVSPPLASLFPTLMGIKPQQATSNLTCLCVDVSAVRPATPVNSTSPCSACRYTDVVPARVCLPLKICLVQPAASQTQVCRCSPEAFVPCFAAPSSRSVFSLLRALTPHTNTPRPLPSPSSFQMLSSKALLGLLVSYYVYITFCLQPADPLHYAQPLNVPHAATQPHTARQPATSALPRHVQGHVPRAVRGTS